MLKDRVAVGHAGDVVGDATRTRGRVGAGEALATPADLPSEWGEGLAGADAASRARGVADYIAGMTDRYALVEHAKYFNATPELR